ncbi:MAG: HD family phosphohydrolase [Bacillota bacterium]
MSFEDLGKRWTRFLNQRLLPDPAQRRVVWAVIFFVLLTVIIAGYSRPEKVSVQVGQPAPRDIDAPRTIVNRPETDRLRQEQAAAVPEVYELNPAVAKEAVADLVRFFSQAKEVRGNGSLTYQQKLAKLKSEVDLGDPNLSLVLRASAAGLASLENWTTGVIERVMQVGIRQDTLDAAKQQTDNEVGALQLTGADRTFVLALAKAMVRPNMALNDAATRARRQEAMDSVEPVKILKGQRIVRKGAIVTAPDLAVLQDLGLLRQGFDVAYFAGAAAMAAILIAAIVLYLRTMARKVYDNEAALVMMGIILVVTAFLAGAVNTISGYLVPVAFGTILVAILIDRQTAVVFALVLAVVTGLVNANDFRYVTVALLGGLAGVFSVARVGQRSDVMRAGFLVGLANLAGILALSLIGARSLYEVETWRSYLWGMVNGLVASILTIGSLPFFENFFGVITSVKLLEISHPGQPLLQKLLVEAPGTYHHSIMVANLAEAATEAIGGDPLLARVGAYYHDVGKTKRPYFFIDNQFGVENPHDKISPSLSTLIITSHVKDGVELAQQYHLPPAIVDIVRQHHGTSLVSYFFSRATENGRAEEVVEEDFRYEGPRPQTREGAVVMLADSVEAAVRSLSKPTPLRIETLVRKIIKDRLDDGQLNSSDLTLRDLDIIASSFVRVLSGIFHPRIEYPDTMLAELRKDAKNGKNGRESGKDSGKEAQNGAEQTNGEGAADGRTDKQSSG